ncbi:MAG TPA: BON domain-containing protein [bacterium]|nr:BON domain-containing protein [bacterium]
MSRNQLLGILALCLITAGCAREGARRDEMRDETTPATQNDNPTSPSTPSPTPSPNTTGTTDETNTGMNVRDRNGTTATPEDQSNSEGDLQITARIRQAILDDQALSVTAENIKIITVNGKVTLRGPVKNAAEKSAIVAKAQQVAGTTQVDDQLEIADSGAGTNTGG